MRTLKFAGFGLTALVAAIGATASCTGPSDDCETHLTCSGGSATSGSSGDAGDGNSGTGGKAGGGSSGGGKSGASGTSGSSTVGGEGAAGGGGAGGGGGCDTTMSPSEESCLVSDDYAVFVSPAGDDKNDGSQAAPFATLSKAVEAANGERAVLVCDATYDEHVVVAIAARVFGGFKCADWSVEAKKPVFKPTTPGPALKIDGVADEVLVQGLSFEVGDAVGAGETALTALINASLKVTMNSVSFKAGQGKSGASGKRPDFVFPERPALDGNNANGTTGAMPMAFPCPGGVSTIGGIGGTAVDGGQNGSKGMPDFDGPGGEAGQAGIACGSGGAGLPGANAPDAANAKGATALGTLTALGWSASSGGDGENGQPGQGGGGGASTKSGGGGGGGAGTCGGPGAKGGQGGGASIAIAVLMSTVNLDGCDVFTADAGAGGGSLAGGLGDKREGGFAGNGTFGACSGGNGGLGGNGGAGGGGAGGISVGIVWKGATAPVLSPDTTVTTGKAGTKGSGGVPGVNDGIPGVSQKVLAAN